MKDTEARGIVLQRLYDLRHTKDRVHPKDFTEVAPIIGGERVLIGIMGQLAQEGLADWTPHPTMNGVDFFQARITAPGVNVVEGTQRSPIEISFDHSINVHGSQNVMVGGQGNTQNVTMDIDRLNSIVDSSNASQTEKEAAKSIFKMLSESRVAQWALGKLFGVGG